MIPTLALFGLLACGEEVVLPQCPEGEVLTEGRCAPYTPGDPVQADVTAITPGVAWQWQLTGDIDRSVNVDVFDPNPPPPPPPPHPYTQIIIFFFLYKLK